MNLRRFLIGVVVAFLVITALLFILAPPKSDAHYPSIAYAKYRIAKTHVNGLCGKGWDWFCAPGHTYSQFRYNSADGHWRVFKVQYAEGHYFDPWRARHCIVNRVSVSGNGVVGTPTRPSYCYR